MPEPVRQIYTLFSPLLPALRLILVTYLFWDGLDTVKIETYHKITTEKVCIKPILQGSEDYVWSHFNSFQKHLPSTCMLGGGWCGNPNAESKSKNAVCMASQNLKSICVCFSVGLVFT